MTSKKKNPPRSIPPVVIGLACWLAGAYTGLAEPDVRITGISLENPNAIELSWSSPEHLGYLVEESSDLPWDPEDFTAVVPNPGADPTQNRLALPTGGAPRRFYRIVEGPPRDAFEAYVLSKGTAGGDSLDLTGTPADEWLIQHG